MFPMLPALAAVLAVAVAPMAPPAPPQAPWPGVRIGDSREQVVTVFPKARRSNLYDRHQPALALPDQWVGGERFEMRAQFDGDDRLVRLYLRATSPRPFLYLDAIAADLKQRLGGEPLCRHMLDVIDLYICQWNTGDNQVTLTYVEASRYVLISWAGPLSPALR